jgi:hypothetical protein
MGNRRHHRYFGHLKSDPPFGIRAAGAYGIAGYGGSAQAAEARGVKLEKALKTPEQESRFVRDFNGAVVRNGLAGPN